MKKDINTLVQLGSILSAGEYVIPPDMLPGFVADAIFVEIVICIVFLYQERKKMEDKKGEQRGQIILLNSQVLQTIFCSFSYKLFFSKVVLLRCERISQFRNTRIDIFLFLTVLICIMR